VNSKFSIKSAVVILGIATLIILGPILIYGIPGKRDLIQHFHHALTFFDSMSAGELFPGWVGDSNGGYGDVSVRFYPPALSILLATGRMLFRSWYWATVAVFVLLTVVGGSGAYIWAKEFVPPRFAVWAGVLYMLTPYHVNELFQSSLVAEYGAASVLPFVFAFTERICKGGKKRDVAGLGASFALLILFNLPMTVIGSYALFIYLVLRLDRPRAASIFVRFAVGIGLGMVCSAFYWVTVVSELSWLRPDTGNPFSTANFIFSNLLSAAHPSNIGYGNLLFLATLSLLPSSLILIARSNREVYKSVLWGTGAVTVISVFMATPASLPLWKILPLLKEVQMPWRWMAVSSMGASVLVSVSIPAWWTIAIGKGRALALLATGFVMVSVAFTISHPIREASYNPPDKVDKIFLVLHGFPTIGQWFPLWAGLKFPAGTDQIVEDPSIEGRTVSEIEWSPEHRKYSVSAGAASEVPIRTFFILGGSLQWMVSAWIPALVLMACF